MTNYTNIAKRVILAEAQALFKLSDQIENDFNEIVSYILNLKAKVILSGIGKSGYIANKIAASFASTGTPAFYLHPAEASHGDLGAISKEDLVIMLSNSGETKELLNIIEYCKKFSIKTAAITLNKKSTLALNSDFLLAIPKFEEASLVGAPTISALAMLSLGDALITATHEAKGFSQADFHIYHPGGKIGANLIKVENIMRINSALPLVFENTSFMDTIILMNEKCLGCALVVNDNSNLVGIITDGDLRRHIKDNISIKVAADIMTNNPKQIPPSLFAREALDFMNNNSVTNIPVVQNNILVGIVNIHDLIKAGIG